MGLPTVGGQRVSVLVLVRAMMMICCPLLLLCCVARSR